jgi:hypothetical protein
MTRGRPFKPGNKSGKGRPKGSRNKRTLTANQMLDENREAIFQKVIEQALAGDGALLRTLLGYLMPQPKEQPVNIGPLRMSTAANLVQSNETVLKKVVSGQITVSQATQISEIIEKRRRLFETQILSDRVGALERSLPKPPEPFKPF